MYGNHYFTVTKQETEISGVLSVQGPVAEISDLVKDITKKAGVECEEITREAANKIQNVEG